MSRIRTILSEHFPTDKIAAHDTATLFTPDADHQVVEIVELAKAHRFRICPAGSMTHLDTDDLEDNVVIVSSENLSSLIDYAPDDLYIAVGAGMKLRDVNSQVKDKLLSFVFGDVDYDGTIGGAVSLGLSAQYGNETVPIKRCVPSLSFATPYGKLIKAGAVTLKSVAGYDVPKLLIGSRGHFGFITSITLRLSQNVTSRSVGQDSPKPAILSQNVGQYSPKPATLSQNVGQDSPKPATLSQNVGQDSPKPATSISSIRIKPRWDSPDGSITQVERNLKSNLDPHGIFPVT